MTTATDLPDLRGWLPAGALARRLAVSPSTIRRRASRGLLEVSPNPLGPGALYRETPPIRRGDRAGGGLGGQTADEPRHGPISVLSSRDRLVLTLLPARPPELAAELGLCRAGVHRALRRLERGGWARPLERLRPGPAGGRPSTLWAPR